MTTAHPFTGALQILYLEDSESDRELVQRALSKGEWRCEFRLATAREEYEAALSSHAFDLIISDFTIPSYSGTAALAFAQRVAPTVPFLLVSGTVGEERAVESLKNGATDYVLKGHLERLVPAVRRALREAEERRRRREAEAKYRSIFENAPEGIYQATPEGRILVANPSMARICGYATEAELIAGLGQSTTGLYLPAGRRAELQQLLTDQGRISGLESQIRRSDGALTWVSENAHVVTDAQGGTAYFEGTLTDITHRKRLEAELQQAQKMEAIGQLAGGVAHDFNNTLTVINGYSRMLLDSGQLNAEMAEQLRQVYAAGMRAANLTRQLLLFSRKHAINKQVIDLNGSITELVKMLGRLIGEHISLKVNLAPGRSILNADAGMMEQVLMNLSVNARDAMPEGGVLTISTTMIVIGDAEAACHPGRRPGEFICLTVSDTGCGIPPENLARIFEPFYTTKPPGLGTGLGLATVFGIVQEHAGWVEVESQPGTGTQFKVFLPASFDQPARMTGTEVRAGKGSETILVVEDEATVRNYIVTVLEHYGYRILQAGSGVDALEVWKWHSSRIALLLTDMVMPDGVSGAELAERLQIQKPSVKVVLMSGYTSEMAGKFYTRRTQTHFIQKPFQPNALAKIVRESLDEQAKPDDLVPSPGIPHSVPQ